ncbi:thiamine phosphate synthase [Jeotgalibaca ciconiae]|uniref:Thiamine-phosphate synthase n=1 Tax=Jeotgalibaca ciconiae TaxID=2496265 RepID=A0A3Q9BKF1_9LACT|nr:thiamine phosphate synthase [Jeotgalibaca ciconiae]AZP04486.1 thiamine phosphate synthase [Jeotgalibaca ciconiae]HJB24373.1 thiamine phosphate synthase [Candidatus Jeotgalibaca pullicola]
MKSNIDYSLYVITNQQAMSSETVEESVKQAILGGCTIVQLREKELSSGDFYDVAVRVRKVTSELGVPFIINDRVDIALSADADGVHVGQSDLPADVVRQLIGPEKIMGVSASNLEEALTAVEMGADYLGVGAIFPTNTKNDAQYTSLEELQEICEAVPIPVVAIGGIDKKTIPALQNIPIKGIAVVSAIVSRPDVSLAAQELKEQFIR